MLSGRGDEDRQPRQIGTVEREASERGRGCNARHQTGRPADDVPEPSAEPNHREAQDEERGEEFAVARQVHQRHHAEDPRRRPPVAVGQDHGSDPGQVEGQQDLGRPLQPLPHRPNPAGPGGQGRPPAECEQKSREAHEVDDVRQARREPVDRGLDDLDDVGEHHAQYEERLEDIEFDAPIRADIPDGQDVASDCDIEAAARPRCAVPMVAGKGKDRMLWACRAIPGQLRRGCCAAHGRKMRSDIRHDRPQPARPIGPEPVEVALMATVALRSGTPRRRGSDTADAMAFRDAAFLGRQPTQPGDHARNGHQRATIRSLIRAASASIGKGLVSTCMPGSRWPCPSTAFSA